MKNRKLSRFGGLTVCILFNFLSLTVIEQSILGNRYKLGNFNRAVAKTADVMGFAKGGLDLAALKIHGQKNLRALSLAFNNSARVNESARVGEIHAVGDRIFALGSPHGYRDTFTEGNITRINPSDRVIQHDAVIHGGNSPSWIPQNSGKRLHIKIQKLFDNAPLVELED